MNYNLTNSALRIFSLLCRSLLILCISYFLSVDDVAAFGILIALSSFSAFFVGCDLYTFTTRYSKVDAKNMYTLLKTQIVIQVLLAFLILPGLVFLLLQLQYSNKIILLILMYTCFEFINLEFSKYLTAKGFHSQVTLGLLLRNGITAVLAFIFLFFNSELRELEFILLVLLTGSSISSLVFLKRLRYQFIDFFTTNASMALAKKMVASSIILLASTICIRGIFTFDKVMYDISSISALVASYVVFVSLGQAMVSIIEATILSYSLPKVIKLGNDFKISELQIFFKTLYFKTILMLTALALLSWILLPILLNIFPDKSYLNNINMYWIVFLAYAAFILSLVANQGLYSLKKDVFGLKVRFTGFLILAGSWWLFDILGIVYSMPYALLLSFFLMALTQVVVLNRLLIT